MAVEICETILTPTGSGFGVQLHISDAPIDDESASFVLTMSVEVPALKTDGLSHIQLEALKVASAELRRLIKEREPT